MNNSIKPATLLLGSQNFGYDKPSSDKDWYKIVIPSWEDICNNTEDSYEAKNEDGSITKVVDIRKFVRELIKCNFQTLQLLYSVETYDTEFIQWFIDNRDRIAKMDLCRSFIINSNQAKSMVKHGLDSTRLTRLYVIYKLLERLTLDIPFEIHNGMFLGYRNYADSLSLDEIEIEGNRVLSEILSMESKFKCRKVDELVIREMKNQLSKVLKHQLYKDV